MRNTKAKALQKMVKRVLSTEKTPRGSIWLAKEIYRQQGVEIRAIDVWCTLRDMADLGEVELLVGQGWFVTKKKGDRR